MLYWLGERYLIKILGGVYCITYFSIERWFYYGRKEKD